MALECAVEQGACVLTVMVVEQTGMWVFDAIVVLQMEVWPVDKGAQ